MNLAPIVLFVYNRPVHTRQTVEALQKNKLANESELYIYSDAAKNENGAEKVNEVREYIKTIDGFKKVSIIEREKNWGLANSIIDGVTKIINEYGRIIVLEDDLIVSVNFLTYMNESLDVFKDRRDIFSITGFNFPSNIMHIATSYKEDIFLSYRFMSWSWGSWKEKWNTVDWNIKDFDNFQNDKKQISDFNRGGQDLYPMLKSQMTGKINSWAIRFCYAHYKNDALCVYPVKSLINNEGFDGSGVHCGKDKNNKMKNNLLNSSNVIINKNIQIDDKIIKTFYKTSKPKVLQRMKSLIKKYI